MDSVKVTSKIVGGAQNRAISSIAGVGLGFRQEHFPLISQQLPKIPWFEILTENFIQQSISQRKTLDFLRAHYPIALHGVSLSIGSTDPINFTYLRALKALITRYEPCWVSDHLSWVSLADHYVPDLLPLPFTHESLQHIISRIHRVQDYLQRPILLENISAYIQFEASSIPEWEFLELLCKATRCFLVLDINNIYVNAKNHTLCVKDFLNKITPSYVQEFHLAGFEENNTLLIDTHGAPIHTEVWELYTFALQRFGNKPTLIEWDTNIPEFSVLDQERRKAEILQCQNV
ncbi:MAG TPA: DUF692 domain-containing protein [Gammaproteobacteria bacterium]|nr:DUF692 domain-containing protein [Gammaproteobacteria bacterium]